MYVVIATEKGFAVKVARPNGQRPKRLLRTDSQCVKIKINYLICLYWGWTRDA